MFSVVLLHRSLDTAFLEKRGAVGYVAPDASFRAVLMQGNFKRIFISGGVCFEDGLNFRMVKLNASSRTGGCV
jgi:hypothetical protein